MSVCSSGTREEAGNDGHSAEAAAGGVPRPGIPGPLATALVIGDTSLTYRDLADASAGLAGLLRRAGARTGSTVCIRLEQSAVAVVAVLAALRVGAAWAALEPDLPVARLRALLNDTDCAVVIGTRDDHDLARLPDTPPLLAAEDLDLAALAEAGAHAAEDPAPRSRRPRPPISSTPRAPAARPRASW